MLKVKTSTATYGYDGLSSYQLAVMRGDWNGTEGEWLKHERYVSVLDSRGDSEVDTMSQKAITDELEAQDNAIEDIREDTGKLGERVEEAEDKVNNMGDVVDEIKSHAPVSARPAGFKPDIDLTPEITVDRAWRDHEGNVIRDTYITRRGLRNEIIDITNQQVTDLKPGSVDPDDLSEATKQLIGNKSITNLPDEEDITVSENQTLKLKDKEYAPKDYSGMGRVYLRKHYVNGVNTLTQHMMRKPNTIYIIQYDYCLAGQTIEVPENCVLDFQGGSLRNGAIIGNNTSIYSTIVKIMSTDIELFGSWDVKEAYPEWFGASRNNKDNKKAIQLCLNYFTTTVLVNNGYNIIGENDKKEYIIDIPDNRILIGNFNASLDDNYILKFDGCCDNKSLIRIGNYSKIRNVSIEYNGENSIEDRRNRNISGIRTYENKISRKCIDLDGVYVKNTYYGIFLLNWMGIIEKCQTLFCFDGFTITGTDTAQNTTTSINCCFANNCDHFGFHLKMLTYCSMISCAADYCSNRTNDGYCYVFDRCYGFVADSIGVERSSKFVKLKNCWGTAINNACVILSNAYWGINTINKAIDVHGGIINTINNCVFQFQYVDTIPNDFINYIKTDDFTSNELKSVTIESVFIRFKVTYDNVTSDSNDKRNIVLIQANDNTIHNTIHKGSYVDRIQYKGLLNSGDIWVSTNLDWDKPVLVYDSDKEIWVNALGWNPSLVGGHEPLKENITLGQLYFNIKNNIAYFYTSGNIWVDAFGFTPAKRKGKSSDRPVLTQAPNDNGFQYYDFDLNMPIYYRNGKWLDPIGNDLSAKTMGETKDRPSSLVKDGFFFYDTTLNKPIWWNGTNWVDATGATV